MDSVAHFTNPDIPRLISKPLAISMPTNRNKLKLLKRSVTLVASCLFANIELATGNWQPAKMRRMLSR